MPEWFLSADPGYARVAPDDRDPFTPIAAFSTRRGGMSAAPYDSPNTHRVAGGHVQGAAMLNEFKAFIARGNGCASHSSRASEPKPFFTRAWAPKKVAAR